MDSNSLTNRLILDGYGAPPCLAGDDFNMGALLVRINDVMFNGAGLHEVVAVSGGDRPKNNGVSGTISAVGGHFACHTFDRRDVLFVDAFSGRAFDPEPVKGLIMEYLEPQELEPREAAAFTHLTDVGNNIASFGQHLILRTSGLTMGKAYQMLDELISTIGMNRLCSPTFSPRDSGFSIIQMIAESHIAVHAKEDEAVLDIFSCKFFSPQTVFNVLKHLGIRRLDTLEVKRGVHMDDKIF